MTMINRTSSIRLAAAAALAVLLPASVSAQTWVGRTRPRPGSVEISGGALWSGSQDLPASAAVLTANPSSGQSGFELFKSEPTIKPAIGVQATVGAYLTRSLALEGGVQVSRPQLEVRLSDDAEDAPDVTASTTMTSYIFTGSLVYHFGTNGRTVPFVAAGAGHLRDVHSGNDLVETGLEYHAMAGIKHWFGNRKTLGIRAEGGVSVRDGGFTFDEDRRMAPTAAFSILYLY